MTPTAEPAQGNHRATYREVLAEPRFRLLFSTRTVAITADALRITTFSVLVFSATGSALLSALAFGIGFIPQLFGSLLLGSLADRLPPRALITGGYALTCAAALLGAGAAATRGSSAARRIADRTRRLREEGKGRDETDERPGDVCRPNGDKCKAGEPVDIATGEMSLTHTDLTLPSAFPLILRRTHLSRYGAGGWFGPSWAATLDQHLELDEHGVVFAGADGMLLTYPVPQPGIPAYPDRGPRWPLSWNGEPHTELCITDPTAGRTLHFAPQSHHGDLPLVALTDRAGRRTTVEYDTSTGTPIAIRPHGSACIDIETHSEMPRITALRVRDAADPASEGTVAVSYEYDEVGNLARVVNSSGLPMHFAYDDEDRITSWTDRNDTSFGYVYDYTGRVLRTLGPDGMWSGSFRYEPDERRTTYTDSLGHATVYEYDERCKLLRTTDPLGNTTTQAWTDNGAYIACRTGPLGHTTRYQRDEHGNLIRVELPDGSQASAVYNEQHLPVLVTDPGGASWQYVYDEKGNCTAVIDPAGASTTYNYDPSGHLTAVIDALGHTRRLTCDAAGLPQRITDAEGHTTTLTRDAFGRPTSVTDALGCTSRMAWNVEGKPTWREHTDGTQETWTWDGEGNLLTHANPSGATTSYTYTHFDLVASRTEADGTMFVFAYDTERRISRVTNPASLFWSYSYDAAGHLIGERDFNGRTLTYGYDQDGRLATRTNGAREITSYDRDASGRVIRRIAADGTESSFTYTTSGRLAAMVGIDAKVLCNYDPVGRLLSEAVNGRTTTYTYDLRGRCISRTTPTGHMSNWTWGPTNRPVALSSCVGQRIDFGYNAVGQEIYRELGDEALFLQTYDAAGYLASQSLHAPGTGAPVIHERTYAYREDGYLIAQTDSTTGTRRFDLTPTGRISAIHGANWSETYAYDSCGNVATETEGHREVSGTLLHQTRRTDYGYDPQGRLTRRTRRLLNGQKRTWNYTWDSDDRLTRATTPDGSLWTYAYDPIGRRIAKHGFDKDGRAVEIVHFTWDGTRLAEQQTSDGTALT